MNNKTIAFIFALVTTISGVYAQQTIESPYSYYGIGTLNTDGSIEESLMGGIGVYADSTRVNMQNPATLAKLKFTAFSAGLSFDTKKIASNQTSVKSKETYANYVSLGFPIAEKLGFSIGLRPYSSVGYRLLSTQTTNGVIRKNEFEGIGNVNQMFASVGYTVYKGLRVGASFKFNFGKTEMTDNLAISDVQYVTREYSQSVLRGFSTNLGLFYDGKFDNKLGYSLSLAYTPESKLTSKNERTISTMGYMGGSQNNNLNVIDSQSIDLLNLGLKETKLTLPTQIDFGVGVGEFRRWFVGIDYTYSNMKRFSNPFLTTTQVGYEDAYKLSIGGFYLPQFNSISSYWKRVTYRAGLRFENTGIVLKNESINDFGISFGVSLPVRGFSNITTGFEYGRKGTLNQNLIKENYFNLKIGFTLNDKWFQKTKYQ
ncbi:membrane protein [Capnocytophaga canis]|uniref:hypothetical protein n=1 Tax=Capnocytophaga canis TaxID=1848903 RepID=UPI001AC2D86E|nr:hypothetical protein [Capnocytophaga canis]GIM61864.1 membrane protein [Capnocytophaga canis]